MRDAPTQTSTLLPAPGEPDAFYVVDLSGWARAIHEVSKTSPGTVTRSVVSKLVQLLLQQKPAFLAFAADTPGPTWQHALWPSYKAKRVDPGPAYDAEIDAILRVLAAHRIPVLRAAGFSADDLLATAARRARACGLRVVVVTRDHDLWQLCGDHEDIVIWDGSADAAIGAPEVRARYGVGPELLGDLMALAGDGDEAPGIAGIGEKTAAELLRKRGSLGEVLRKWAWEEGARRTRLRDGAEAARMSRQLVTLRDDVPIAFDLEELAVGWDAEDAATIRQLGAELDIPRMCGVEPLPKSRPSAELRAAAVAAPAAAEVPRRDAEPTPAPTPEEPASASRAPAPDGEPTQQSLFAT